MRTQGFVSVGPEGGAEAAATREREAARRLMMTVEKRMIDNRMTVDNAGNCEEFYIKKIYRVRRQVFVPLVTQNHT